jgi:hypothetical protein
MSRIALSGNPSGSGTLTIASPNTNSDATFNLPTTGGDLLVNGASQAATFSALTVNGNNISATNSLGFRNRIINGDMRIDQRNNGAAVTATGTYPVDRFIVALAAGESAFSAQQDSSAPDGFTTSTKITVTTAEVSVGADDRFAFQQRIEGTNVADLNWGATAASAGKTAATVTVSFWVRSSVTGTFGGVLRNSANDRSYPFTYSISTANTWEKKSVTIAGDTSGTWLTTNGIGVVVNFSLMAGTNFTGTAGAWTGAGLQGATGQTQLFTTLNATWQITGVQLEAGSVATPFERRPYGTELLLCQRYYEQYGPGYRVALGVVAGMGNTQAAGAIKWLVVKRASPVVTVSGTWRTLGVAQGNATTPTFSEIVAEGAGLFANATFNYTAGTANNVQSDDSQTGRINISAEL